jgi:Tfp pilus assembly protein PilV
MLRDRRSRRAFALYEVLLGVTVFVVGVLALGRSVQNCLNASSLSAEDVRVRLLLANRMAEIQVTPTVPDPSKEFKINTGYGIVRLIQKTVPVNMVEEDGSDLTGIRLVTLTAEWLSGGTKQSKRLEFYVYRAG